MNCFECAVMQVKEAHYRKYPDWKWGSKECKKSSSGDKRSDPDVPSLSDENGDLGPMRGSFCKLICYRCDCSCKDYDIPAVVRPMTHLR